MEGARLAAVRTPWGWTTGWKKRETSPKLDACGRPGLSPVGAACRPFRRACQFHAYRNPAPETVGTPERRSCKAGRQRQCLGRLCQALLPARRWIGGFFPFFPRHLQDRTAPAAKTGSRTRFAPEDHYRLPWFRVAGINGDEKNHAARRKRGCESFLPLATSRPAAPSSQPCLSSRPRKRARSNGPGMTRWAAFSAKKPNRS